MSDFEMNDVIRWFLQGFHVPGSVLCLRQFDHLSGVHEGQEIEMLCLAALLPTKIFFFTGKLF